MAKLNKTTALHNKSDKLPFYVLLTRHCIYYIAFGYDTKTQSVPIIYHNSLTPVQFMRIFPVLNNSLAGI